MGLAAGDRIGPYRIVRLIGAGGMGAVHEAVHELLEKPVALKTLHGGAQDATAVARFVDEGRAASKLRHPNVVDVTDVGVHEGTPFLVMELLAGESLAHAIARGPIAPAHAAEILLPIVDALATAHDAGIVHRDLKPENVFLARVRGRVVPKLLDFGISRASRPEGERLTQTATMLGTPCYMAPEQVRDSKNVDARSDVFSLGLVLYEMLSGVRAIRGETMLEVLHKITAVEVEPLARLVPGLDGALVAVVTRMIAARPEERFASMNDVASALAQAVPGTAAPFVPTPRPTTDAMAATGIAPTPSGTIGEIAFPPLDVVGVQEPSGWLGAAAAMALARRARWLIGGGAERVIGPAALAGLATEPSQQMPVSPFDDAALRETARQAARAREAVVTGSVERRRGRILLRLRLEARLRTVTQVEAEGGSLASAAREAVTRLGLTVGWRPLDESVRETYDVREPQDGLLVEDASLELAPDDPMALARALAALGSVGKALGARYGGPAPDYDGASAATRAFTATALVRAARALPAEAKKALADDLERAVSPEARAVFRAQAATRAVLAGDGERAWSLALRASSIEPTSSLVWASLALATPFARMTEAHCWRIMSWAPDAVWCMPAGSPEAERVWRPRVAARTHVLQPGDDLVALVLAHNLVRLGELTAAESLAAELDDVAGRERPAEATRALVDLQQARFARALERLTRLVRDRTHRFTNFDVMLVLHGIQTAEILGRGAEYTDSLLSSTLLDRERELDPGAEQLDNAMVWAASLASHDVAAAALVRLRALHADRYFQQPSEDFPPLASALEHRLAGRNDKIVGALRPLAMNVAMRSMMASLLDVADAPERAAKFDDAIMASAPVFGGLSMAHVRSARRHARAGRHDEARALARRILDAWSDADEELPLLEEMRVLAR